jgi:hypothetical protein
VPLRWCEGTRPIAAGSVRPVTVRGGTGRMTRKPPEGRSSAACVGRTERGTRWPERPDAVRSGWIADQHEPRVTEHPVRRVSRNERNGLLGGRTAVRSGRAPIDTCTKLKTRSCSQHRADGIGGDGDRAKPTALRRRTARPIGAPAGTRFSLFGVMGADGRRAIRSSKTPEGIPQGIRRCGAGENGRANREAAPGPKGWGKHFEVGA